MKSNMRIKIMSVVTGILIVLCVILIYNLSLMSSFNGVEKNTTFDKIIEKKEINVCYINYAPLTFKDPKTGELTGHFIDTIEGIARSVDWKINYHETTWSTFVIALETGQCDLSVAGTFKTILRAKSLSFTNTLFYAGSGAIVRQNDTRFEVLNDFNKKGVIIAVTQGEASFDYAKIHFPKAELIVYSNVEQSETFTNVLTKRADVALGDFYATKIYAQKQLGVVDLFAEEPYNLLPVGWAVRQEDFELLHFINTAIEIMQSSGQLVEFEEKYDAHWIH